MADIDSLAQLDHSFPSSLPPHLPRLVQATPFLDPSSHPPSSLRYETTRSNRLFFSSSP